MALKTRILAEILHSGQVRKLTGEPYFVYPEAVANIVREHKRSRHIIELIVSAYLHDLVENCDVSIDF